MANDAANLQLPIMLRQPKMVWPGLDKEGRHLKSIAGDGNCLFASLSDQLYGDPSRHVEIRATIIEHMRTFRPLYEDFVHTDDVIQRRATRATTETIRKNAEDDAFEGYLSAMSRSGTYGGQPELQAFVRAYDQDVTVHLPPSGTWNTSTMPYHNEHRELDAPVKPSLHICYGGDEEKNAHYDSSQKSEIDAKHTILATRPKSHSRSIDETVENDNGLTPRAMRNMKSDPSRDMMHELVTRGSKEVKNSLDLIDRRARSPSVASSHYSTSSKRSFEDDGDQPRATKRADRKKRSLRSRAAVKQLSCSPRLSIPTNTSLPTSSGPPTPTSSQDTDSSSDRADGIRDAVIDRNGSAVDIIDLEDDSDEPEVPVQVDRPKIILRTKPSTSLDREVNSQVPILVSDQPRQTLRT